MTIKRLGLTIFLVALTSSIGLVSVNLPLSSYAQNNALSQKGNGDSEQQIGQLQSSDHNGQAVSGDSSVLSGNNLLCQDQENSVMTLLGDICDAEISKNPNQITNIFFTAVVGDSPRLVPSTNLDVILDGRTVFNETIVDKVVKRISIDGQPSSFLIVKGTANNFEIKDMRISPPATCQHTVKTFECRWNSPAYILMITLLG